MNLYFCGLDQFNCLIERKQGERFQCENRLTKVENINKVMMRLSLAVYQRIGDESTWFIKGLGVSNETELFSSCLKVSEVCLTTSTTAVGFSKSDNILYRVEFKSNSSEHLTWDVKKVEKLDPAVRIIQIVSNDEKVYGLDDQNGVYEINVSLILKWRIEGVQLVKLASGFGHFVALSDTGALYSWGSGGRGELGHADEDHVMTNCEVPKRIDFFDDLPSIVKNIACGGWHTLVLTSDGDVYSWGWNESGQLGHSKDKLSAILGQPYPVDLGSAEDPIIDIAAGARHSYVLLKSGKIFSWGLNKNGQLGVGDLENKLEPTEVDYHLNLGKPVKIDCGRWCTFIYFD